MLFEGTAFSPSQVLPELSGSHVFKNCSFALLGETHAQHVDAEFLGCDFSDCKFYWALFNLNLFYECKFQSCTFRGVSFADCTFVRSTFSNCRFIQDKLGGGCSFDGTRWLDCSQSDC